MAPVAAEAGLPFTFEEFQENLDGRSVDDTELEAVAGGGSCWLFGHSDGPKLGCEHDSGIACAYLGIGM